VDLPASTPDAAPPAQDFVQFNFCVQG